MLLDQLLEKYIEKDFIAGGIAATFKKGEEPQLAIKGKAAIGDAADLKRDALFRIYSMTKPVTSLAAMMCFEEGCFDLDDPVSKYLPAFAKTRIFDEKEGSIDSRAQMTIRHVFTHTAGITLPAFSDDPLVPSYLENGLDGMRSKGNLKDIVDRLGEMPVLFEPGSRWKYSMATDILGRLVEIWSGLDFETFLKTRLFDPLDMKDTAFHVPEEAKGRLTTCYAVTETGIKDILDSAAESSFLQKPEFPSGSGGLVSTTDDFLKFMTLLMNKGTFGDKQFLKEETFDLMTQNRLNGDMDDLGAGEFNFMHWRGIGFGLGFYTVMDPVKAGFSGKAGEYGWTGAAGTIFFVNPAEEIAGLLMVQHMPGNIYPLRAEFRKTVYRHFGI